MRERAFRSRANVRARGAFSCQRWQPPIAHLFPLAKRGMSQCQTNAIISETKVFGRLGHAIRREPFRQTGIVPIRVEHERRTHHHSAAPIEPLLLLTRSGQATRIHQRDLPLKFDAAVITLLQFGPRWLGPETPGRNNIEIIGYSDKHVLNVKKVTKVKALEG